MKGCTQTTITDDAFRHLTNLQYLDMSYRTDRANTECSFRCLPRCAMFWSRQRTITDAAFRHLTNLRSLTMIGCKHTITDAAFRHLTNLHSLEMNACNQITTTDNAFRHLMNLQSLDMRLCNQSTITEGFAMSGTYLKTQTKKVIRVFFERL